ncbi:MAG: hypothetical protein Q9209_000807 [Squamulea sp. 1 TL-2023]
MRSSTISVTLALLASVASAAPSAIQHETRQVGIGPNVVPGYATVKFTGGNGTSNYYQLFPLGNDEVIPIYNPTSVSVISTEDNVTCTFKGVNGGHTSLQGGTEGEGCVDVEVPQKQVSGTCCSN